MHELKVLEACEVLPGRRALARGRTVGGHLLHVGVDARLHVLAHLVRHRADHLPGLKRGRALDGVTAKKKPIAVGSSILMCFRLFTQPRARF